MISPHPPAAGAGHRILGRPRGAGANLFTVGRAPRIPRGAQLQPVVAPQVSHFRQVPLRTSVMFWHSGHGSPS